ncbi:GNAT family N-acetyltransferase [Peptostreptococcaceae bacterium AGR-M142]
MDARLKIQKMTREDVDKMDNWVGFVDKLFDDYNFPILTEEQKNKWFHVKNNKYRRCYSIYLNQNLIGYISLRDIKKIRRISELGIVIDSRFVSKGYGTKALEMFLDWYFKELDYNKIYLRVASFNQRAIKLYKNMKFKKIKDIYETIDISKVDLYQNEIYKKYKKDFVISNRDIKCKFYLMELSTKEEPIMWTIIDYLIKNYSFMKLKNSKK